MKDYDYDDESGNYNYTKRKKKTYKQYNTFNFYNKPEYIKGEMKYFDSSLEEALNPAYFWDINDFVDPVYNCLFAPLQGPGENERIGKQVKVMKIKIKGFIYVTPDLFSPGLHIHGYIFRIVLVWDKLTNGTRFHPKQLFIEYPGDDLHNLNSFQNLDSYGRLRIMKDIVVVADNINAFTVNDDGDIVRVGVNIPFKISHTFFKPVSVRFNDFVPENPDDSRIESIEDNSFHLIAVESGGGLISDGNIVYQCRVCYKE